MKLNLWFAIELVKQALRCERKGDKDLTPLQASRILPAMKRSLKASKACLRARCLSRRKTLSPECAAAASRGILQRLRALDEYAHAHGLHTYVSRDGEVDTHALIRLGLARGKRVVVPVVQRGSRVLEHAEIQTLEQLQTGLWGLLQPALEDTNRFADLAKIDLVVVPGLAFDERGFRLGFGGGYYDRFLARIEVPKIGLTYSSLFFRELPVERHDVRVDIVLTESKTYRGGAS